MRRPLNTPLLFRESDLGIGNRLHLLDDEILTNLDDIQICNGLRPSGSLASGDFTVEMETGSLPLSRVLQRCELSNSNERADSRRRASGFARRTLLQAPLPTRQAGREPVAAPNWPP